MELLQQSPNSLSCLQSILYPTTKIHIWSLLDIAQDKPGATQNLIQYVFPVLSSDTIILQSHQTTHHLPDIYLTQATINEVNVAPSRISFCPLSTWKIYPSKFSQVSPPVGKLHKLPWALSSLLLSVVYPNHSNIYIAFVSLSEYHTKTATYSLSKLSNTIKTFSESILEPEKWQIENAAWMGQGWMGELVDR